MASPVLVARTGVGAWTSIKYLITRGLDIGEVVVPETTPSVISNRHSESRYPLRLSYSTFDPRASSSPRRTRQSES